MRLAIFLILPVAAQAAGTLSQGRAVFLDPCHRELTGVTTSKGESLLRVDISGLVPGEELWAEVRVSPAGDQAEAGTDRSITFREHVRHVPRSGRLKFLRRLSLSPANTVWNAEARWYQRAPLGKFGAASSAIYVVNNKRKRFYRLQGAAICTWRTPVTITSEYRYNNGPGLMSIIREEQLENAGDRERGLYLGLMPEGEVSAPLIGSMPLTDNYGWLFAGWQSTRGGVSGTGIVRSWQIAEAEGGFLGRRLIFRRYPASEYRLEKAGRCETWMKSRDGFIDRGEYTESFYTVPRDLSGDADRSAAFMEEMAPALSLCDPFGPVPGEPSFRITDPDGSNEEPPLFFYPQKP